MLKPYVLFLFHFLISGNLAAQVPPLIETEWSQNCYYNDFLPELNNPNACNKAYAGCYAVAWSQIFNYYKFPVKPNTTTISNSFYPNLKVKLSDVTYTYSDSAIKIKTKNSEVAKIIYHIGIAANTNWDNKISLTDFDALPLITHFNYSPEIKKVDLRKLSRTEKISLIKNELNHKRPVFAKNSFHYYLIDGYNEKDEFHFNFGWSGQFNGYYDIENCIIAPGNLNPIQIMINIKPNYDF